MENERLILKAISDNTRLKIVKHLLHHNCCVKALARRLELTEAAISQHLKVLREAGLLVGVKRGYFMHYDVNREELLKLSIYFKELAEIQRKACNPENENCTQTSRKNCHAHQVHEECPKEVQLFCHGPKSEEKRCEKNGHFESHKS
ncbi:MAG: ArsR/SmtB family transcription factor [Christensenellales bacterium]|jgi:ArsR family transcriptional regulator